MADWLVGLAQMIPVAGSYLSSAIQSARKAEPNENLAKKVVQDWGSGITYGASTVGGGMLQGAGAAFGLASDYDPTQLATKPIIAGLHRAGIGQQGDEWDKGLLGLTGTSFDKVGRLATFATLWSDAALGNHTEPLNGINLRKKAWDMAFASGGDAVSFGEVILANNRSLLVDPSYLDEFRKELDGTWYGGIAVGALNFGMYAALDPTRGVAKVAKASRADKFVNDAARADELAKTLNVDKLPMTASAATDLSPTLGAKTKNVAKALVGSELDDATVVGNHWKAIGALDNETDVNKIINYLDPMLGTGGTAPRSGIPVVAEMMADAARYTDDITLQRQIKLNIQYALTGSEESMNWLVKNAPIVAAKGRRVQFAPSEFTLLEDVMNDFAAKGNVGGGFGGSMGAGPLGTSGDFNLGQWISRHYDDPIQQAELYAYGETVQSIQRFKAQIWSGGPQGQALDFGMAETGLQVAPRNLEKLKTALHNKVLDEHLFQDGASGRTMRILNAIDTAGVNGFISVADPVHGNKQLISTLKQFSGRVDGVDRSYIQRMSQQYLALDPSARGAFIRELNDDLLARVAAKHGLTEQQLSDLMTTSTKAYRDGREYASKVAKQEAARGNPNAFLGDLTGTDTVLPVPHLQSHLDETEGLFDWQTADRVARQFKSNDRLRNAAVKSGDFALEGLSVYHTVWKYAQLGRPGLMFRVLMDTDLRATAMIGSGAMLMQSISGAANMARNLRGKMVGSVYDTAVSSMDEVLAKRAAATAAELRAISKARSEKIALRQEQAFKADDLALRLEAKVTSDEGKLQGNLSVLYAQKAQRAKDLANRLAGDTYTFGGTAPLGQKALLKEQALLGPAEVRAASAQTFAARDYLSGGIKSKKRVANTPRTHKVDDIEVQLSPVSNDMEWATLADDVRDSGAGLSELLLSNVDRNLWKGRTEAHHWNDHVLPDDVHWSTKYAKTAQQFRESYTARRLLTEGNSITDKTPEAIFRSFMRDPAVIAEFRATMGGGSREDLARWLSDLTTSIRSIAPTEKLQRRLMQEKVLDSKEVEALVPMGERFPIFAPNIVRSEKQARAAIEASIDTFFKHTVDLPDVYLARVPAYNGLYHRAVDRLLPGFASKAQAEGRTSLTADEMVELHSRAKQQALNSVHRDMYDINRQVGVHGVMRYIAPFFNPWFDSMTSWARLIYDDPSRFGMLMRYSQTPDMYGITVDRDGNKVNPWDGTPIEEKSILVPLAGLGGVEHFRLSFASLNTITQGNTPFSPGMGPLAQLSGAALVTQVLPRVFPEGWEWMAKNPNNQISQTLFPRPGDVPKGDVKSLFSTQLPAWWKSASDVLMGEEGFGNSYINAYGTRVNDLIRQYREKNGGADPIGADLQRIFKEAESGAKAAAFTRTIISFGLGLSGNSAPEGQFYVDKMHSLVAMSGELRKLGMTPEQVFAANYPHAANLNWKYSINEGRLEATVNATTAFNRYRDLMRQNPEIMWFIAGPDNIMANTETGSRFSQGAYNQQRTEGLRRKYSQQELNQQTQIEMAWGKINQFDQALALYMQQNGIKDLRDANAGNLSVLRRQFRESVAQQYPDWAREMASGDAKKKRELQVAQIKNLVADPPPGLAGRKDIELTRQYLLARESVIQAAREQGIVGWDTAQAVLPLRLQLLAFGQKLAREDIVFAQAWSRLFGREFNDDTIQAISMVQTGQ